MKTKNRLQPLTPFQNFNARLREFIRRHSPGVAPCDALSSHDSDTHFNQLALELFALQFESVLPYRQFCEARNVSLSSVKHWSEIPAIPTSAFKDLELTSLPMEERSATFHSSGTTEQKPSRHFHCIVSLSIYEASITPWFQQNFLADWDDLCEAEIVGALDKPGFIFLTPSAQHAPHSSLIHMFETVRREFGSRDSFFGGRIEPDNSWGLDMDQVFFGLRKSMCANRPVSIMGTAFSFVHLLDYFEKNNIRYRLATGSRVLETGGYKGRSRVMPKEELHALITKHLGIPASHIICEYGMSELSSQAYDRVAGKTPLEARRFMFPPWAKAQIISPETGLEVGDGETGLIRIFDLANVRSVMALQTEDLGKRHGNGFELLGRATVAEPRGCSLMAT